MYVVPVVRSCPVEAAYRSTIDAEIASVSSLASGLL
jgi:hypothetical protein